LLLSSHISFNALILSIFGINMCICHHRECVLFLDVMKFLLHYGCFKLSIVAFYADVPSNNCSLHSLTVTVTIYSFRLDKKVVIRKVELTF